MDTRIYIATHKAFQGPGEDIYIPLHVGRRGKADLGYIGDHTDENISAKNSSYCELTGLYWMWKNVSCDIIGLCHYRRYFVKDEVPLNREYIEHILETHDIILGNSSKTPYGSEYKHYANKHYVKDLEICKQVTNRMYPDYQPAFDLVLYSNLMNIGNMMICRKELFDSYCEWLFPLLFEIEKQTDISSYDDYQKRLYGFLAERLLRVWVMMQNIKVREETVEQIE